jgi:AraC-like DNA-binding protein
MPEHNPDFLYRSPKTVALHLNDHVGRMWLGGREVPLQPGDFTLTPAGLVSRYDLEGNSHHLCVHFGTLPPGRSPLRLPLHWRTGPHERAVRERLQEVIDLHRLASSGGPRAALAARAAGAALQSLLLWIAVTVSPEERAAGSSPTRVDEVVERVRRHLAENYRAPLDVAALARQVGVSQNYLARQFRARHGVPLKRYVLGRRIELARHLLAATRLPIKAVAIEAGLGNPQYFHRRFRLATGRSPSEERGRAG